MLSASKIVCVSGSFEGHINQEHAYYDLLQQFEFYPTNVLAYAGMGQEYRNPCNHSFQSLKTIMSEYTLIDCEKCLALLTQDSLVNMAIDVVA
jgi:hypothetical protein